MMDEKREKQFARLKQLCSETGNGDYSTDAEWGELALDLTHDMVAEIVRQRAELAKHKAAYNDEIDQFNAGVEAGEKGGLDPFDDAPHFEPDYDVWRNGYYSGSYDRLTTELAALRERTEGVCRWRLTDDDCGCWSGDCGIEWIFNSDGPEENEVVYCLKCGRKLEQIEPEPPEVE